MILLSHSLSQDYYSSGLFYYLKLYSVTPISIMKGGVTNMEFTHDSNSYIIDQINDISIDGWDIYYENKVSKGFTVELEETEYHVFYDGTVKDVNFEFVGEVDEYVVETLNSFAERNNV